MSSQRPFFKFKFVFFFLEKRVQNYYHNPNIIQRWNDKCKRKDKEKKERENKWIKNTHPTHPPHLYIIKLNHTEQFNISWYPDCNFILPAVCCTFCTICWYKAMFVSLSEDITFSFFFFIFLYPIGDCLIAFSFFLYFWISDRRLSKVRVFLSSRPRRLICE